jgi:hypothetical protein
MIPAKAVREIFGRDTAFARAVVAELALRFRDMARALRLRTSGNTFVRPISRTEYSLTTTKSSRLQARPGTSSLPSLAGSHQLPAEAGQPSVRVREDWYYSAWRERMH